MTDPYSAAEASSASSSLLWALIAAVVLLTAVAAMYAPELRRRLSAERRHRADLRRVNRAPSWRHSRQSGASVTVPTDRVTGR